MKREYWLVLFFALVPWLVLGACTSEGDAARKTLEERGVEFNEMGFLTAVQQGDEEAVALFLKAGAGVNVTWPGAHVSALMVASMHDRTGIAAMLISRGAQVNFQSDRGDTALHYAAYVGDPRLVNLLIDAGAWLNSRSNMGDTPLITAARFGRRDVVVLLLQRGADPLVYNMDGESALDAANTRGHEEIVSILENPPIPT